MTGTGSARRLLPGLLLLALAVTAVPAVSTAGLSIEASIAPDHITAGGDAATLTVVVRASGLHLPEPPRPQASGLAFDPAGTAQNFSMVQGSIQRSVTAAYRVRAEKPGTYTIPPFRVAQGSEAAETKPLLLTVLPPGTSAPRAPATRESWSGGSGPPEVFARLLVDRDHVCWNQEIVARLRIYARVPLEGAPDWTAPVTQGFWVEDLGAPTAGSVRIGDYVYVVNEIRWALFPTKTGPLTIGPARIRCRIDRVIPPPDPWSSLGFPDVRPQDVTLATDPVPITVQEVPPGAPDGYAGAVGSYSLSVRVDRRSVPAGEPAIVTTEVWGSGNVASLHDPEVAAPPSVRRYVAGSSTQIDRSGPQLRGTRTQQVAILSESPGTIRVGPVRFAWFDPSEGRFHSVTSESIRIQVTAATGAGAPPESGLRAPEPTAPPRSTKGPEGSLALTPPAGVIPLSALALAGYATFALLAGVRNRRARNPRGIRRATLLAAAASVAAARRRLGTGNTEMVTSRAGEALLAGLAARYDVPVSGLARGELLAEAARRGAEPAARDEIAAILEALDAIAFAPPEIRAADAAREMRTAEELLARWRKELSP